MTGKMPECDIILLSYESPNLLKKCVWSVLDHTRVRSRLIIVDNASRDPEVKSFLNNIHGNSTVTIEKVFSEENAGFAGGMNKGMRLSDAPHLCLLNNDCIVTDGWLEEMISIARSREDVGLVNPQSNTFGSRPSEKGSIDEHAFSLERKKGTYLELGHAIGFACLIKKEVVERIGYLDEEYQGVCYEDTDFSIRAQKAGFISVLAEGAYVFHLEQASRGTLEGKEEVYRRNREIFERKWGKLLRVFCMDSRLKSTGLIVEEYENLKGLARERAIVDMLVRPGGPFTKDEISRRTIRHTDIGVNIVPAGFAGFSALWRVLTKKKKYDAVIVNNALLMRFFNLLKPFHGAEIFSLEKLKEPSVLAKQLRGK